MLGKRSFNEKKSTPHDERTGLSGEKGWRSVEHKKKGCKTLIA